MGELFYTRHGQTQWNLDGRLLGYSEVSLCDEGIAQAELLASLLKYLAIEKIVASPLKRSVETAKILANAWHVPMETDIRLIERDFGTFEGIHRQTLIAEYGLKPGRPLSDVLPPDAELLETVAARAWPAIDELISGSQRTLVVGHSGVFRALWQSNVHEQFSELKFGHVWQFIKRSKTWDIVEHPITKTDPGV